MSYDEHIAERIRALTADEQALSERKMFGGLAFLIGGNMAVAASGEGGILVRVDPAESESLVAGGAARMAVMRGREMRGWLRLDSDQLRGEQQLERWVGLGVSYARSLPEKR